jgi:GNAT superfamily N-acetyltransferase
VLAVLAFWKLAAEDAHRPTDSEAALRAVIARDPDALVLAHDEDGDLVGTVIAGWDGWRCHLYRLAVAPGRRRQGIGRLLLDHAERRFAALGGTRADAMVLGDNDLAHHAWAARGYTPQPQWQRWVKPCRESSAALNQPPALTQAPALTRRSTAAASAPAVASGPVPASTSSSVSSRISGPTPSRPSPVARSSAAASAVFAGPSNAPDRRNRFIRPSGRSAGPSGPSALDGVHQRSHCRQMGWDHPASPFRGAGPGGSSAPVGRCLPAVDRLTRRDRWRARFYRSRSWLLCRCGRHLWATLRNPDVGGRRAMYQLCRRCGRERDEYDPPRWFSSP